MTPEQKAKLENWYDRSVRGADQTQDDLERLIAIVDAMLASNDAEFDQACDQVQNLGLAYNKLEDAAREVLKACDENDMKWESLERTSNAIEVLRALL